VLAGGFTGFVGETVLTYTNPAAVSVGFSVAYDSIRRLPLYEPN
jgi:hypothetical protein